MIVNSSVREVIVAARGFGATITFLFPKDLAGRLGFAGLLTGWLERVGCRCGILFLYGLTYKLRGLIGFVLATLEPMTYGEILRSWIRQ